MARTDENYRKLLTDRISELSKKISELEKKDGFDLLENREIRIQGYKLEIERIQEELKESVEREKLSDVVESSLANIDKKYEGSLNKQKQIQIEIEKLKELKKNLKTKGARRRVDRRIDSFEEKITKLKKANVRRDKIQRSIMYPKYRIDMIKKGMLSRAQGKVNVYKDLVSDNKELKKMLNENSVIDNIKGVIYDIEGRYYQCRLERAEAILKALKSKKVKKDGARVVSIPKKKKEEIEDARRVKHELIIYKPVMA